jgi:AraC-like DNA-binding protein/quercetin dioxygenase-like cupin family protein
MIPVHDISEEEKKEIKIVELLPFANSEISEIHRHQFFECFVFLKGGGTHSIDFIDFPIHSNSIHIITPGQVHEVKREKNSHGFVFMFELTVFNNSKNIENFLFDHTCYDVKEFSPFYLFDNSISSSLEVIVNQIWKNYNSESPIKNQLVINQLSLLLLYCLQTNIGRINENNIDLKHSDTYTNFRRLLNSNFKELKKVKEYANLLSVSEKLLNEIVTQRTGENVSAHIYKQLILEAKRLLNTGVSTKEVAYDLSFSDPAHFSKFFKSQTGFSPSEFKDIHH